MGLFKKKGVEKVELKKQQSVNKRNIMYYGIIAAVMILAFVMLQVNAGTYKKEVRVVSLKSEIGNQMIVKEMLQPLTLVERNVTSDMVRWSDADSIVGMYPTMQIRRNTPVFRDMVSEDQVVRYRYLYELKPDEELLTFSYSNLEAGGRIPQPGDRFRIRGSFKVSEENRARLLNDLNRNKPQSQDILDEEGNVVIAASSDVEVLKGDVFTSVIFDVVTVVDMLNANGDSIYEIRRKVEAFPRQQREEKMESEDFKVSSTPHSLLLVVKSEQVGRYVQFQGAADAVYTLTLLTRDNSLLEEDLKIGGSILER